MPLQRSFTAAALMLAAALGMAACEEEGPAEQVGEQIDESAEETGEALEDAGDEVQDSTD